MNTLIKPLEHKEIIRRLRQSAKKRGIEFDLDESDLDDIGFPISCPILDRKSTRLNSSHSQQSRMPSSA